MTIPRFTRDISIELPVFGNFFIRWTKGQLCDMTMGIKTEYEALLRLSKYRAQKLLTNISTRLAYIL